MSKKEKIKYSGVGGEALIEGIMMKGPYGAAIACRMPDGSIDLTRKEVHSITDKYKFLKAPFIRGPVNFVEQMLFGYKCMMESAEKTSLDTSDIKEEDMSKLDKWLNKHMGPKMMNFIGGVAMVFGLVLAFAIFFVLPSYSAKHFNNFIVNGAIDNYVPMIESVMRIIIFVAYMFAVSQMKDIKRVFKYHGAEHKSIFCVEHGLELTVENVRKQKRFHPRCGTSFIFITLIISLVLGMVLNLCFKGLIDNTAVWIAVRIAMLPIIMSIAYECIRIAGKHDNFFTRMLSAPGLLMQRITTKEPEDDIIEVGIAAIKAVIEPPSKSDETKDESKPTKESTEQESENNDEA